MTHKMYLHGGELGGTTKIVELGMDGDKRWVRLNLTWFHPQGGGQKSDKGTIGGVEVTHVVHDGGDVRHYVASHDGLEVGTSVGVAVDEGFRQTSARLHTAGHLIAAAGEKLFPTVKATTGHHWPGEARVEFAGEPLPDPAAFQNAIAAEIEIALTAGRCVSIEGDPDHDRSIRIDSYPSMPCGGTHLSSLAELGKVVIRSAKVKSGKLRIGYDVV